MIFSPLEWALLPLFFVTLFLRRFLFLSPSSFLYPLSLPRPFSSSFLAPSLLPSLSLGFPSFMPVVLSLFSSAIRVLLPHSPISSPSFSLPLLAPCSCSQHLFLCFSISFLLWRSCWRFLTEQYSVHTGFLVLAAVFHRCIYPFILLSLTLLCFGCFGCVYFSSRTKGKLLWFLTSKDDWLKYHHRIYAVG